MDDLVVEFDDLGMRRVLSLQIKRSVTISGATSNDDFRGIIGAAVKTQGSESFTESADLCGFVVEHVTAETFRSLIRLIDWAKASPTGADFEAFFAPTGTAAADERNLRNGLLPVIEAANVDGEIGFYRHFVALHLHGLEEGGVLRTEVVNRLQELIAVNEDGQIFCCSTVFAGWRAKDREAAKSTRASPLEQLRGTVRLKVIPYLPAATLYQL